MMPQHTLNQLHQLRLDGMARALEEQWTLPASHSLSFDERLGLLLDRELAWRDNQRLVRLRKKAKLKYANACLEDLDRRSGRALDERLIATLASGDWIRQQHNLLLTGPTGAGKTWLACALGNQACRQGYSTLYLRIAPAGTTAHRSWRRQLRPYPATAGKGRRPGAGRLGASPAGGRSPA